MKTEFRLRQRAQIVLLAADGAPTRAREQCGGRESHRRLASTAEWALLALIVIHVAAALAHLFIYRDRVIARMLPG